jgi:hypothetical protein
MSETVNTTESLKPGTKPYLEAQLAAQNEEMEALKAELEAMKAEKEAEELAKGTSADTPCVNYVEEKVEIFVPRGYANDEPNLLISVNGVNYLLPRGKSSKVPKFVADEFYRGQRAQQALDEKQAQMLEAAK